MTYSLRRVRDGDWPAILATADAAAPWAIEANRTWLANRQAFDAARGWRRQYVAVEAGDVVAYGAIEGVRGEARARLFIVAAGERLEAAGGALFTLLREDAAAGGVAVLWMREEAKDETLLALAATLGFAEAQRFAHDGVEMVVLERAT